MFVFSQKYNDTSLFSQLAVWKHFMREVLPHVFYSPEQNGALIQDVTCMHYHDLNTTDTYSAHPSPGMCHNNAGNKYQLNWVRPKTPKDISFYHR